MRVLALLVLGSIVGCATAKELVALHQVEFHFDRLSGPQVAGGNYAYEQYQRLFPPINNPLVQPYAAFTGGQLATLAVEALIEKYVADKMKNVVGPALRAQAEREAREEVARALAQYWAARSTSEPEHQH